MVAKQKPKATVAYGSTVGYGTGQYDKHAHSGHGKDQKALGCSSGEDKGATPHATSGPVKDGVSVTSKSNARGIGYQKDAHSDTFHGNTGQAIGVKDDNRPFNWEGNLHGEGPMPHVEYNTGGGLHGKVSGKAEHLPHSMGPAHTFDRPSSQEAMGFGHEGSQKQGVLRMSGHKGAHRVGYRGKPHGG